MYPFYTIYIGITKFAQWIATRPDLFPLSLCIHFQDLQSNQTYISYNKQDIIQLLSSEYDKYSVVNWRDHITLTSPLPQPTHTHTTTNTHTNDNISGNSNSSKGHNSDDLTILGSGCIAQVVQGYNPHTHTKLAIKLVHPYIKNIIQSDLLILNTITYYIEYLIPGSIAFSLYDSTQVFSTLLLSQLNMITEANNLQKFRKNFLIHTSETEKLGTKPVPESLVYLRDYILYYITKYTQAYITPQYEYITFPKPYTELCTPNILVEE